MTPKEYWDKLSAAIKSNNHKEASDVINDYINFALNEISRFCEAHVNAQTISFWVYALREVSDIYSKYEDDSGKALIAFYDKYADKDVKVITMPDWKVKDNAET